MAQTLCHTYLYRVVVPVTTGSKKIPAMCRVCTSTLKQSMTVDCKLQGTIPCKWYHIIGNNPSATATALLLKATAMGGARSTSWQGQQCWQCCERQLLLPASCNSNLYSTLVTGLKQKCNNQPGQEQQQ